MTEIARDGRPWQEQKAGESRGQGRRSDIVLMGEPFLIWSEDRARRSRSFALLLRPVPRFCLTCGLAALRLTE